MPALSALGHWLRQYWWVPVADLVAGGIGAALAVALAGDDEDRRRNVPRRATWTRMGWWIFPLSGDGDEARNARAAATVSSPRPDR
jgi:hypothetical protein